MMTRKQIVTLVGVAALTSALAGTAMQPETSLLASGGPSAARTLSWMYTVRTQPTQIVSAVGMR